MHLGGRNILNRRGRKPLPLTTKTMETRITSSNKRERTITITKSENGRPYARYRSVKLTKEEFNYYTNHATENDIRQFLKSDDYNEIPLRK